MSDAILVLNAGSSSVKFALYGAVQLLDRSALIGNGEISGLGGAPQFVASDSSGTRLADESLPHLSTHEDAIRALLDWIENRFPDRPLAAAGHRVVHGGSRYTAPVRIDAAVIAELTRLIPLAPLHQPHHLAAMAAVARLHPQLPQVACFDTAFHHSQLQVAAAFALPRALSAEGIRRYGFHGISYEYIASVLPLVLGPDAAEGRVIVAHLGSGASMCAMRERKSVATTMSFTALDGLVMGSRCGALDPGVVLYLIEEKKMSPPEVTDLLYNKSGLLGVSGISDDMRALLVSTDGGAKDAIDLFVYRIGRELGSLAAALGGLDALVFTAGIGEHAVQIRRRVCRDAAWLGIAMDDQANEGGGPCISNSRVSAWVVPTDEDIMIARYTVEIVGESAKLR
jgi:acetate kinase